MELTQEQIRERIKLLRKTFEKASNDFDKAWDDLIEGEAILQEVCKHSDVVEVELGISVCQDCGLSIENNDY